MKFILGVIAGLAIFAVGLAVISSQPKKASPDDLLLAAQMNARSVDLVGTDNIAAMALLEDSKRVSEGKEPTHGDLY